MNKLDKWIEKKLKDLFHSKRDYIINKMIANFEKNHPEIICTEELRQKFETEADRVYAIVDRSILRDRIQRAKYTFWATAVSSVILIGSLGAFSSNSVLPFITPIMNAFISWFLSIVTISISYHQRIKGGMDSVVVSYEKSLSAELDKVQLNNMLKQSSTMIAQKLMNSRGDIIITLPAQTEISSTMPPKNDDHDITSDSESVIVSIDSIADYSDSTEDEERADSRRKKAFL